MTDGQMRIGDAERDDALSLLQEHLAAGRLTHDEFDERVGAALAARTQGELDPLFADLPGRHPGAELEPVRTQVPEVDGEERPHHRTPWFAQWWMMFPVVAIAGGTRFGWLIPIAIVWLFWLYPAVVRPQLERRPNQRVHELPPRDFTPDERTEIEALIRNGKKIAAIKYYRELTGAGLADAKRAIEHWL